MKINNKLSKLFNSNKTCIAASFSDDVTEKNISQAFKIGLNIAEIRLDLFSNLETDNILKTVKKFSKVPTIATIRSNKEGGNWSKSESERLGIYKEIMPFVDAVDIELISEEIIDEVIECANQNDVNIIISHHNFDETPSLKSLEKVIEDANNKGADIIKIATLINLGRDIEALKELLIENNKDRNLIVIGMGGRGLTTRLEFPKLGSLLTFCSYQQSTAAGQISLEEMVKNITS